MQIKISAKLALCLTVLVAAVGLITAKTYHKPLDSTVPVVFQVSPPNPAPDSDATYTIQLSSPASTDQVITIGSTDPTAFVSLPPYVIVPAGSDHTSFPAHTSSTFHDWNVLAAVA